MSLFSSIFTDKKAFLVNIERIISEIQRMKKKIRHAFAR